METVEGAGGTTAAVGHRIGALIIDGLLCGAVFIVIGLVTGGGQSGHGRASVHMGGTAFLVYMVVWIAYFTICEAATGQTLGKRLSRIRVVSQDGGRVGFGQSAARNVLRLVDALPILYIVGLVSVLATGEDRRQRVGDIAARTRVVTA